MIETFSTGVSTPVEKGGFPALTLVPRPARRRVDAWEVDRWGAGGWRVYEMAVAPHKNDKSGPIPGERVGQCRETLVYQPLLVTIFALRALC